MTAEKRYGLQKVTLADYPGEVAATLFMTGCNMRCPYCHNTELAAGITPAAFLSLEEVMSYLRKRSKVLGGVCITGGEPLLNPDLPSLVDRIHQLGLKVKLDTNGTLPDRLKKIKADYIAMDLKTAPERYGELGYNNRYAADQIKESIDYIINSKIPHEFRTTAAPGLVEADDVRTITRLIPGCERYVIARFMPDLTLDPQWQQLPPRDISEMKQLAAVAQSEGVPALLRGVPETD